MKKILGFVLAFAVFCSVAAALGGGAGAAYAAAGDYAPSKFAAVTAKPSDNPTNRDNLLRAGAYAGAAGSATDRLSTMIGTGVQETTGWYNETLGWAKFASGETGAGSSQINIAKQTGLAAGSVENNTSTYAKVQLTNAVANNVEENIINYKSTGGDSPLKLGGMDTCILYFALSVKVEQTTWFDITIENINPGTTFFDLGRRFKVEAADGWKEIGKDANGNYLPFRKPETLVTGNGTVHARNSSSRDAAHNAKEDAGSVEFAIPAGDYYLRIYTYTTETGNPAQSGLTGSASYSMTNAWMWKKEWTAPVKVTGINARSRAFLSTQSSSYNTLSVGTVSVTPNSATNKDLVWATSDPSIATVSAGVITAVAPGTCDVTITAADGSGVSHTIAVTVYDDDKEIYLTPDQLDPMTKRGTNVMMDGNFTETNITGRSYVPPGWTFTNTAEIGSFSESLLATWEHVDTEGLTVATRALRITNNGNTTTPLYDSLTFSGLHAVYGVDADDHVYYFSTWVKVQKTTWFDITLGYSNAVYTGEHYEGQKFYDLGRKFKVTPEMGWTEIGKDGDGNYLPFRSNGNGTDPGNSSSSSKEATNAKESVGNTLINLPGDPASNSLAWGCIRIYAYGSAATGIDDNGIGFPSGANRTGFVTGDSYDITGVSLWAMNSEPEFIPTPVSSVTLNKTTLSLKVDANETLVADVKPDDATDKAVYWSSSDSTVASVDQNGKVTAKKVGTATITVEANDGSGEFATCVVTVTAAGTDPDPTDPGKDKGGCKGTAGASSAIAVMLSLTGAMFIKRKRK